MCEGCFPSRLGGRHLGLQGLKLRVFGIHELSLKWSRIRMRRIVLMERYSTRKPLGEFNTRTLLIPFLAALLDTIGPTLDS